MESYCLPSLVHDNMGRAAALSSIAINILVCGKLLLTFACA